MRILVAEQLAREGIEILRAHHEVDELVGVPREDLLARIGEYDALMVRSQVQADAELIAAGSRLVVIGRAGVGVDNVDLDAALRRGEWKSRSGLVGVELRGKTLGIVGLGKIGQAIADRARAMEMTILGSDPFVTAEGAARHGIELVELPELLRRVDVLTVHVPLTRATRGLIGAAEIATMKRGALVVNVARGGIYDEAAVADALRSGQLGGAAFDVFESEPPTGSPLLDAPNTVLTPHLGASTAEAQVRVAEEAAEQVVDVLDGRPARYAVNAPLLTPETARAIAPFIPLAEMLGRFFAQFARSGFREITLEVAGDLAGHDVSPLAAAVLRGMLETTTTERVNLVGGTISGGELRLVRLDDYQLDVAPTTTMLITRHTDRPGMIGRVGTILAGADVNISAMSLARTAPRADALMVLALDDDVSDSVARSIGDVDGILDVWTIHLGGGR